MPTHQSLLPEDLRAMYEARNLLNQAITFAEITAGDAEEARLTLPFIRHRLAAVLCCLRHIQGEPILSLAPSCVLTAVLVWRLIDWLPW